VCHRNAKHREHRITAVFLDGASKVPDFLAHPSKVAALDFPHILWVQPLRERSKPDQVAEKDCDLPALGRDKSVACRPRKDGWPGRGRSI
jgi:hypothetical protein